MGVTCPECGVNFHYVDGYLFYYREYIEIFVDPVHSLPLVPGYSTSGQVMSIPDDLLVVDFGLTYRRPPDVFFLVEQNKSARQWIEKSQLLLPISIGEANFILFSRSLDQNNPAEPTSVKWMAIGEVGQWETPLWLNYLHNAVDLVRKEEDVAAIVMLMIALDFYYDYVLERLGVSFEMIRRIGRRPGMNEKRAKLQLMEQKLGRWPADYDNTLTALTDFRNKIVHGDVKKTQVETFSGKRAFQVVLRAVMFLIEMMYRPGSPEFSGTVQKKSSQAGLPEE